MNRKPLTKSEAEELALKYQHLEGRNNIAYIAVAPFDYKRDFASWYHINENIAGAEYPNLSGEYDVVAIVNPEDSGSFYVVPYHEFSTAFSDLL